MRASRLLAILIMLKGKGRLTAQTLAERFEVSTRTIYRDIDELSAAGVPIIADRGVGGGIALARKYESDFSALTPAEAAAFSFTELPDLARQLGIAGEAAAAKAKILDSLDNKASLLSSRFHFDPSEWYRKISIPKHLQTVVRSTLENRSISISYKSWKNFRRHIVDPLGIVVKSGTWYLLAKKQQKILIFNIEKISILEVLEDQFALPQEFDLAKIWKQSVSQFEKTLFSNSATIKVFPDALDHLDRLGDLAKESILTAKEELDGSREVTIAIESIEKFARDTLWFAGDIAVIGPQALLDQVNDMIVNLQRHLNLGYDQSIQTN